MSIRAQGAAVPADGSGAAAAPARPRPAAARARSPSPFEDHAPIARSASDGEVMDDGEDRSGSEGGDDDFHPGRARAKAKAPAESSARCVMLYPWSLQPPCLKLGCLERLP